MSDPSKRTAKVPPGQRAIRAMCFQRIAVQICENGAHLIAGMLGVLEAGKFVTLLDPTVPKARIATVLRDAQAQLVITDSNNASHNLSPNSVHGRRLALE